MELEYPLSGRNIESTLTDEEKWYFDLQGYLILRQVISPEKVQQLCNVIDQWFSMKKEDVPKPVNVNRREYTSHIGNPHYGHQLFQDLVQNEHILRVVMGLMWNRPRLFVNAVHHQVKRPLSEHGEKRLHKDHSGFEFPPDFRNPHNDYQAGNGKIYCNFLNAATALSDVPPGMGFCCVPGSHKSQIKCPASIAYDNPYAPAVTFEMKAGDCIIFSPGLMHDSLWWQADHARIAVISRYQFSMYFNENPRGGYPLDDYKDKISADQYEMECMGKEEKAVVRRILQKLEKGEALC